MKYVSSSSPQIKDSSTTKRIMIDVCIALLPACIVGCIFLGLTNAQFGLLSVINLVISTLSAVLAEFVFKLCVKKSFKEILSEFDFTSVVTGLLIGMNVYADTPWYVCVLSSVFAIVVVKMLFGGTGKNIANPAIVGRIFAFIAFGPALGGNGFAMTQMVGDTAVKVNYQSVFSGHSLTAGATPLNHLLNGTDMNITNLDLFLGSGVAGTIGEISKVALLVGGIYLIIRGVIDFRWPLIYILSTGVFAVLSAWITAGAELSTFTWVGFSLLFEDALATFLPSILSGGLFLGAIFMATDYVTTPVNKTAKYIYFTLLGLLTAVLRQATGGEVVSFAILLGNLLVPLFDTYIVRRPFGYRTKKEAK